MVYCATKFRANKQITNILPTIFPGRGHCQLHSNNLALYPNASAADDSGNDPDILSNGFKQRAAGGDRNANGENIIYMAFAENPFVTSGGLPGLAE